MSSDQTSSFFPFQTFSLIPLTSLTNHWPSSHMTTLFQKWKLSVVLTNSQSEQPITGQSSTPVDQTKPKHTEWRKLKTASFIFFICVHQTSQSANTWLVGWTWTTAAIFRATSLDDESAIKEKRIPASHIVKVRVASTLEHHVLYVVIDLK